MKHSSTLLIGLALVAYFSLTGFQCGSAEVTSAKLYMQQQQWAKAEESLQREIAKDPNNEEAWFLLGQTRLELKNYEGMNDAYNKALGVSPAHKAEIERNRLAIWANLYNEGVASYNKGKEDPAEYDTAISQFATAIKLQPDSSTTYYVAALAHYAKKDLEGAQGKLEMCMERDSNNGDAAIFLGQLYYLKGSELKEAGDPAAAATFGKAAEVFEMAYQADPSNAETIANLIDSYEQAGQSDKALALTRDAVARDPQNKIFRYAYGVFLLKQGDNAGSVEQFQKAVDIDPNYEDAVYNLGVAYLNWGVREKKDSDQRAEEARKAGKKVSEDRSYQERFKQALPWLERASEKRPNDALLWQQLGRVYANLNMVEKSKAAFDRFDQISKEE